MKASVYYENGGPEVLKYETVPDPRCPDDGLVIRTEYISLEGADTVIRSKVPPQVTPYVGGFQSAGEIVEIGKDVSGFKIGQKVVACSPSGSHAELRPVPAARTWVVPAGMDLKIASAVPIAFGTSHVCLFAAGHLKAGETVLLQTGAGGLSVAAIQLASQVGARVIVTSSSQKRLDRLKRFGMSHGINHRGEDVLEEVKNFTDGAGVDLVVDSVGGKSLELSLQCAREFGRAVMVGDAGRDGSIIDSWPILARNITLRGVQATRALASPEGYATVGELLHRVFAGELTVEIDSVFPLSDAAAAHAHIESRTAVGRVLLTP